MAFEPDNEYALTNAIHGTPSSQWNDHFSTVSINANQIIGSVGTTGNSSGNHLHFEVKNGNVSEDPFNFVIFPDIGY